MRPQQQGRRQRNRSSGGSNSNNNRRNQNPLSRNYESNGPDVKIRGNAQLVADKYSTLARDALSAGDNVMAENYLQHAEHYNRIIMAAQAQMQAQREERNESGDDGDDDNQDDNRQASGSNRDNQDRGDRDDRGDDDRNNRDRGNRDRQNRGRREQSGGQPQANGAADASEAPQPVIGETPVEVALEEQEQVASGPARKPRRPRKPRRTEGEGGGEDAGDAKSDDATSGEAVVAEV
jgi:hypothetical protein